MPIVSNGQPLGANIFASATVSSVRTIAIAAGAGATSTDGLDVQNLPHLRWYAYQATGTAVTVQPYVSFRYVGTSPEWIPLSGSATTLTIGTPSFFSLDMPALSIKFVYTGVIGSAQSIVTVLAAYS